MSKRQRQRGKFQFFNRCQKKSASRRALFAHRLEPRVLFSAAPVEMDDSVEEPPQQPAEMGPPMELVLASPANSGEGQPSGTISVDDILKEQVASLIGESMNRWAEAGATGDQLAVLAESEFSFVDLPENRLAMVEGNRISIDPTAAGYGWFVDETPGEDEEFSWNGEVLEAIENKSRNGVDLLSVLMHEQGHLLGLLDDSQDTTDVMHGFIGEGERRIIEKMQAEGMTPLSLGGQHFMSASMGVDSLTITPAINEGGLVTVGGTVNDPAGSGTYTLTINWDSANGTEGAAQVITLGATNIIAGTVTWDATTKEFEVTHVYTDDNPTGTASDVYDVSVSLEKAPDPANAIPIGQQLDKITSSTGAAVDEFGGSVAISGNFAAVGVPFDENPGAIWSGSVIIYERQADQTWDEITRITAKDIVAGSEVDDFDFNDAFGTSVALDGNLLVVGAVNADLAINTRNEGAAYVFERDAGTGAWNFRDKLLQQVGDANISGHFGSAVAIEGDTIVVGAEGKDISGNVQAGAAYLFERTATDEWTEVAEFNASDPGLSHRFGDSLAIDGGRVVVGAAQNGSGAVYIFEEGAGWATLQTETTKLVSSDGGGRFGISVDIENDTIVVGSRDHSIAFGEGAAYIYELNSGGTWDETKLTHTPTVDSPVGDRFGSAVAISNGVVSISAPLNNFSEGAAYLFEDDPVNGWQQYAEVRAGDAGGGDQLGAIESIAIEGDVVLVGSRFDDDDGNSSGSAYFFATEEIPETVPGAFSSTLQTTVSNVDPTITGLMITPSANENGIVTVSGTISDVGTQDTFTLTINWDNANDTEGAAQVITLGDVDLTGVGGVTWDATTREFFIAHQYLDDNPTSTGADEYEVSVGLRDDDHAAFGEGYIEEWQIGRTPGTIGVAVETANGSTFNLVDQPGSDELVRYDSDGNQMWVSSLPYSLHGPVADLAVTDSGVSYVIGTPSNSFSVSQINADGSSGWYQSTISTNEFSEVLIDLDSTQGLVSAVQLDGSATINSQSFTDGVILTKQGLDGSYDWAKQVIASDNVRLTSIATDDAGNTFLAISRVGGPELITLGDSSVINSPQNNSLLLKYDSSGSLVFGVATNASQRIVSIEADSMGRLVAVGKTAANNRSFFIARYDVSGVQIEFENYTIDYDPAFGNPSIVPQAVGVDDSDRVVVAGRYESGEFLGELLTGGGGVFVARFNEDGELGWIGQTGETAVLGVTNTIGDLAVSEEGDIYLSSSIRRWVTDSRVPLVKFLNFENISDPFSATLSVSIANVPPVISVDPTDRNSATLTENGTPNLSATDTLSLSDVGTLDTHTISTGATVGTAGPLGTLTQTQLLAMFSAGAPDASGDITWNFDSGVETFEYLNSGESLVLTYTVSATDDDTGTDSETVTITINGAENEVAPEIRILTRTTLDEGESSNVLLTFAHENTNQPFTITAAWDDPNNPADSVFSLPGLASLTVGDTFNSVDGAELEVTRVQPNLNQIRITNRAYADDSDSFIEDENFNLTITIEDAAGLSDSRSIHQVVRNVDPTISGLAITPAINENQTVSLTGTITDPGTLDTFTLTIDWDKDGSTEGAPETFQLGNTDINNSDLIWDATTREFTIFHQYLDDNPTATTSDNYNVEVTLIDDDHGSLSTHPVFEKFLRVSAAGSTPFNAEAIALSDDAVFGVGFAGGSVGKVDLEGNPQWRTLLPFADVGFNFFGRDIVATADGRSYSAGVSGGTFAPAAAIAALEDDGTFAWGKTFPTTDRIQSTRVALDSATGDIVTAVSFLGDLSVDTQTFSAGIVVMKHDADGNLLWSDRIGGGMAIEDMEVDTNGDVHFVAASSSQIDIDGVNQAVPVNSSVFAKLSGVDGSLIYATPTDENERFGELEIDSSGNAVSYEVQVIGGAGLLGVEVDSTGSLTALGTPAITSGGMSIEGFALDSMDRPVLVGFYGNHLEFGGLGAPESGSFITRIETDGSVEWLDFVGGFATAIPPFKDVTINDETGDVFVGDRAGNTIASQYTAPENFPPAFVETVSTTVNNVNPVISINAGDANSATFTEDGGSHSVFDTLSLSDVGTLDTFTASIGATVATTGPLGSLTQADLLSMFATAATNPVIRWSFDSDTETFSHLNAGETLTLGYEVILTDDDGGTTSETVTITINGADLPEAPTIDNLTVTPIIDEGNEATVSGTVNDPNASDTFTLQINWDQNNNTEGAPERYELGNTARTKAVDGYDWDPVTREFSVYHTYLDDDPTATSSDLFDIRVRLLDSTGIRFEQVGNSIPGEALADGVSSVSLGNRLAIGSAGNDDNGNGSGHARVFRWDGSDWVQIGADIDGDDEAFRAGVSVSLNQSGNRLAVGSDHADGDSFREGHVKLYEWNGSDWVQMGSTIEGVNTDDQFGANVRFADNGDRVVIASTRNDDAGNDSGHVKVYEWDGTDWQQLGSDIGGAAEGDRSGESIAVNGDGDRIIIGSPNSDANGIDSGQVRVFEWDGSDWTLLGNPINGINPGDRFGNIVDMGHFGGGFDIAIATNSSSGPDYLQVYRWNGTDWEQRGSDVVRVPSGGLSAIGIGINSVMYQGNLGADGVSYLEWDFSQREWVQVGLDIPFRDVGTHAGDLNRSGTRFAIGDIDDTFASAVHVYEQVGETEAFETILQTQVRNLAPQILNLSATDINEGGFTTVTGQISDAGVGDRHRFRDTHELEIQWDASTTETIDLTNPPAHVTYHPYNGEFSITHQYLDDDPTGTPSDTISIQLTVRDDDTGNSAEITTLTISNLAPTLTLLAPAADQIFENEIASIFGTIQDPGELDTFTLTVDWDSINGTEGAPEIFTLGLLPISTDTLEWNPSTGEFRIGHRYLDDNPTGTEVDLFAVSILLNDDDAATVPVQTGLVEVTNTHPGFSADSGITNIDADGNITFSGTLLDDSPEDTFFLRIVWDYDDTAPVNTLNFQDIALGNAPINAGGITWDPVTRQFSIQHQYPTVPSDGFTIGVFLDDDDTVDLDPGPGLNFTAPYAPVDGLIFNAIPEPVVVSPILSIFSDMDFTDAIFSDMDFNDGIFSDMDFTDAILDRISGRSDRIAQSFRFIESFGFDFEEGPARVGEFSPFERDKPLLTVVPSYAGQTRPGTVIRIQILGEAGDPLSGGEITVVADVSGNWTATFPGLVLDGGAHYIQIEQTAPSWSGRFAPESRTQMFFSPTINQGHTDLSGFEESEFFTRLLLINEGTARNAPLGRTTPESVNLQPAAPEVSSLDADSGRITMELPGFGTTTGEDPTNYSQRPIDLPLLILEAFGSTTGEDMSDFMTVEKSLFPGETEPLNFGSTSGEDPNDFSFGSTTGQDPTDFSNGVIWQEAGDDFTARETADPISPTMSITMGIDEASASATTTPQTELIGNGQNSQPESMNFGSTTGADPNDYIQDPAPVSFADPEPPATTYTPFRFPDLSRSFGIDFGDRFSDLPSRFVDIPRPEVSFTGSGFSALSRISSMDFSGITDSLSRFPDITVPEVTFTGSSFPDLSSLPDITDSMSDVISSSRLDGASTEPQTEPETTASQTQPANNNGNGNNQGQPNGQMTGEAPPAPQENPNNPNQPDTSSFHSPAGTDTPREVHNFWEDAFAEWLAETGNQLSPEELPAQGPIQPDDAGQVEAYVDRVIDIIGEEAANEFMTEAAEAAGENAQMDGPPGSDAPPAERYDYWENRFEAWVEQSGWTPGEDTTPTTQVLVTDPQSVQSAIENFQSIVEENGGWDAGTSETEAAMEPEPTSPTNPPGTETSRDVFEFWESAFTEWVAETEPELTAEQNPEQGPIDRNDPAQVEAYVERVTELLGEEATNEVLAEAEASEGGDAPEMAGPPGPDAPPGERYGYWEERFYDWVEDTGWTPEEEGAAPLGNVQETDAASVQAVIERIQSIVEANGGWESEETNSQTP